jgi:hypothetical protein
VRRLGQDVNGDKLHIKIYLKNVAFKSRGHCGGGLHQRWAQLRSELPGCSDSSH